MKTRFVYMGTAVLTGILFFSCSDETAKNPKPVPDKDTTAEVSLVIKTKDALTRADTYPSESEEAVIADKKIKLYVYKADGELEYVNENLQLDNDNKSEKITLTIGEKYFYVSANTSNSDNNNAKGVSRKSTPGGYEQQAVNVNFSVDVPDLTKPNFVLGTLWQEKKEVMFGMTDPIQLNIGRIVAKVKLVNVEKGTGYSVMQGAFTEPQYTIGAVPTRCYWVGQYDHNNWTLSPPPGDNDVYGMVKSVVHNEPPLVTGSQNPLFHNYSDFIDVTAMPIRPNPVTHAFYVIENTTAKDALSQQYYGNTTYIRLKTVYEPVPTEIYDKTLSDYNQALTNKTFWTIIHNGVRYIVNEAPSNSLKDEDTEIKKYENGENFHRFAIKDTKQNDVEKRHSVYRNHFYEVSVTGIRDLGEPTDIVDPKEPIPVEEEVAIKVNVTDWSRVVQNEDI